MVARPSSASKIREKNCCWTAKSSSTKAKPNRKFKHMKNLKFITRFCVLAGVLILVLFIDTVQVSNIFSYSRYWRFRLNSSCLFLKSHKILHLKKL